MESYKVVINFKIISLFSFDVTKYFPYFWSIQTVISEKYLVKIKMRLKKDFVLSVAVQGYKVYKVIKNFSETFQKFSMYIC